MPRPCPDARDAANTAAEPQPAAGRVPLPAPLRDPLAVQVFAALRSRAAAGTPAALASFVGVSVDDVQAPLKLLADHGLIEPVDDRERHEQTYRATGELFITNEEWAQLPVDDRRELFGALIDKLEERIWSAMPRGGFDAPEAHVSWLPVDLDQQGYEDLVRAGADLIDRLHAIQAAVVERRAAGTSDGRSFQGDVMFLQFQRNAAGPSLPAPRAERELVFDLGEDLVDGLAAEAPEWHELATPARKLAALVQQFAATP